MTQTRAELAPWLAELDEKIRDQAEYGNLAHSLGKTLGENQNASCWLSLRETGEIEKLTICNKCSDVLDQSILSLVRNVAPLKRPPGNLAYPRNILIKFQKIRDFIQVTSEFNNRVINQRIGVFSE